MVRAEEENFELVMMDESETQMEELVFLFISKLPENWKNRFQSPKAA